MTITKPLRTWGEFKKAVAKFSEEFYHCKEKYENCIRWEGGDGAFEAIPNALDCKVFHMAGEPYTGTLVNRRPDLAVEFQNEVKKFGFPEDMCAYMRTHWGSILADKFVTANGNEYDGYPLPDFYWQTHACCSHARWFDVASKLIKSKKGANVPVYVVDVNVGPINPRQKRINPEKVDYIFNQLVNGIKWLEDTTGYQISDKKLIGNINNEIESTRLWAEIMMYQQNIPAPLDEKMIFPLFTLAVQARTDRICVDLYRKLLKEIKQRVEEGIPADPNEKFRIISDAQPPWMNLDLYKEIRKYGALFIGSLYTFSIIGAWEFVNGKMVPRRRPEEAWGVDLDSWESALKVLTEWHLKTISMGPATCMFNPPSTRADTLSAIADQWNADAIIVHLNRGCEGLSLGLVETTRLLKKRGYNVFEYEGNCADPLDFDYDGTLNRLFSYLETRGLTPIIERGRSIVR